MLNFYSNKLLPNVRLYKLQATIGIDFLSKTMYLEDRTVRLQLWQDVSPVLLVFISKIIFMLARVVEWDEKGGERDDGDTKTILTVIYIEYSLSIIFQFLKTFSNLKVFLWHNKCVGHSKVLFGY